MVLLHVSCEQMDWGDNPDLVEESDTIQGRDHIKQMVVLVGDSIDLECQVAFTSNPFSKIRWKIDGKPETKMKNTSSVTKNGEVFVEEHLVIANLTEALASSTVSCEYSKGHYGAGVEAILRVFTLEIIISKENWENCEGEAKLVFRERSRSSPAEESVNKRIQERIHQLTKTNEITVDHSGYLVTLPLPVIQTNEGIVNMQPKLFINGSQVIDSLANCGTEFKIESEMIGNGNVISPRQPKTFWGKNEKDILPIEEADTLETESIKEYSNKSLKEDTNDAYLLYLILIFVILIAITGTVTFLIIHKKSVIGKCIGR